MRLKLLLVSLLFGSVFLYGQEAYTSLIISEARVAETHQAYVEFTNVGDETINLSEFKFGKINAWNSPWNAGPDEYIMLEDLDLGPDESYVISVAHDYNPLMWLQYPDFWSENVSSPEIYGLADYLIHVREEYGFESAYDSVHPSSGLMTVWNGRDSWYLEHHFAADDSAVVDQVNGIFDEDNTNTASPQDCAGVTDASFSHILVRKYSIKNGNLDYETGRGQDISESEWMPIPLPLFPHGRWDPHRRAFWTIGTHGDYNLDESTLVSSEVSVDFANKALTVPWGIRNNDSLMMAFDKTPGVAWHYDLALAREDSSYISARTGDILTVFVCGTDLDSAKFSVTLTPPTDDENRVLPMSRPGDDGWFGNEPGPVFEVTDGLAMDTILSVPFATRTDSLKKYLEKAPQASWAFDFVGDTERPDVVDGDILIVTSANGDAKEYYIKVEDYHPGHDSYLGAITWPDMPSELAPLMPTWDGDTIPGFSASKFSYKITLPPGFTEIPALIGVRQDLNSVLEVTKPVSLLGTIEERTMVFTVTAEDDTTISEYFVQIDIPQDPDDVQPYLQGKAFISELALRQGWNSTFVEICNPNGEPMDMSDYMIVRGSGDPYDIIDDYTAVADSLLRYNRYVPGYRWGTTDEWETNPAVLQQDLSGTNSIVQPGDVFVVGTPVDDHWKLEDVDFDLRHPPFEIETVFTHDDWGAYGEDRSIGSGWRNNTWYLFRITNPEVKAGTKPATDPLDFEIVDIFGQGDGSDWVIGGVNGDQNRSYVRKSPYYKGKIVAGESFGTTLDNTEWMERTEAYYSDLGYGWPQTTEMIADGVGNHYLDDITEHLSTVKSRFYAVSTGFTDKETIDGIITGTTVTDFIALLVKAKETQVLTVKSYGLVLESSAEISDQDTLVVVAENGVSTTKYILSVGATGLSDDAVLVSTEYTIDGTVEAGTGTVGGFDYGVTLATVMSNVTVPDGATMIVHDSEGALVSTKMRNFDSTYVDVLASDDLYFEVVAENSVAMIDYQLTPNSAATDAFILSAVYTVMEDQKVIELIPGGTTVSTFFSNIVAATGATVKVIDKAGFERASGYMYKDDKLVVTAQDGVTEATYVFVMLEDIKLTEAYVTSELYVVDQDLLTITGGDYINDTMMVKEFLMDIDPVEGATMTVMADMTEKDATDLLAENDKLRVTSGTGLKVVYYDITVVDVVGIDSYMNRTFNVYPNPSNGVFHISGLEMGDRIQVFNSVGRLVIDKQVSSTEELISIGDNSKGLYIVRLSTSKGMYGTYKLIVE